ncbi:MAG: alpha-isopropylmalate synthase regulatory domain-containing protein [Deltaproteobacteria bacterium]
MARELKEEFFRLDGAWASFELMSIRKRDDYLKPFRVLRCKIDDQVDFRASESLRSTTEASLLIEMFGAEELVAATGRGPVHAVDNAMRKVLEKHYPQLAEVRLVISTCACCTVRSKARRNTAQPHWCGFWEFSPMIENVGEQWESPPIFFRLVSSVLLTA